MSKSYQNSWMAIQGNQFSRDYISLAASSASIEEQANSALEDGKFPMVVHLLKWSNEFGGLK